MRNLWYSGYHLIISLWIGGIALFTFIITPAVFKYFERNMAGDIVGKLFPGYFMYNLVLSVLALILLITIRSSFTRWGFKLSLVLVISAVIINTFVALTLHPEMRKVKQHIHSFERTDKDSVLRKKFGKLHAVSALLNLLLLADGVTLLSLSRVLKKE
jgi:uncharacterized membrane protein